MPEDGGLYVPDETEDLRRWILYTDENTSFTSIAGALTSAFIKDEFSPIICETIAMRAFPFTPVIRQLEERFFLLDFHHGPTGCHRDFSISYLAACMETVLQMRDGRAVFLDVTCGELGASVVRALRGKRRIRAVLLYPKGRMRGIDESDFVWNGGNIYPVEFDGTEADCHDMVREIFRDRDFVRRHGLTVANTANIGCLLPLSFFYTFAFSRIKNKICGDLYYALPAGHYANVTAGLYSWQYALPLNGIVLPASSALTVDVSGNPVIMDSVVPAGSRLPADPADPSSLERLDDVFGANRLLMRHFIYPVKLDGRQTAAAAKDLFRRYKVYADEATAGAYAAQKLRAELAAEDEGAFILVSRDHPSLSADYVRHTVGEAPEMPDSVREALRPVNTGRPCVASADELRKIVASVSGL